MFSIEEEEFICVGTWPKFFKIFEGKLSFQKEEQGDVHCVDAM